MNSHNKNFSIQDSVLGKILIAENEKGICNIFLGDNELLLVQELESRSPKTKLNLSDKKLKFAMDKIIHWLNAPTFTLDLPLDISGSLFQQRVWKALMTIPVGQIASYSKIANLIGAPKSMRAVANACGANPISLIIPCHRVIRNDGKLSGYRWGIEKKRWLLAKEHESMAGLFL